MSWWNWGILYLALHKKINITLRDEEHGERFWDVPVDIGSEKPELKWKGFEVIDNVYSIDAGGFVATIEHLQQATTAIVIPEPVLQFYRTQKQ